MKFLSKIFGRKEQQRGLKELAGVGFGTNKDWPLQSLTDDADVWMNAYACIGRVRDLFKSNSFYQSYRETLWSNVLGSDGIMLRMRVKEKEDRIVQNPDEKSAIRAHEERYNRVMEWVATKEGREFKQRQFLRTIGSNGSTRASVKVGDPDIYANTLIERRWKEWQRSQYCDVRGTRNYSTIRQLRLISAVRDGDFFIRMVMTPQVNKFGFSLQLINGEWCDRFFNATLDSGNVVRMGIEYQFSDWGLGRVVAYHFIKRHPQDWQYSANGFTFSTSAQSPFHERIPADEIIHYARAVDAEGTRPYPWVASTIQKSRQLDQAMLAEVIAWRQAACKTGYLYSDVDPDGGMAGVKVTDPSSLPVQQASPGGIYGLPWGVKFQAHDPTHPNASVEEFQKAAKQDLCAGMVGSNYSTMANDYEAINFSAGRLQRLDTNESNKLLQAFDIEYAENKIFEKWLEWSLITRAIPLPMAKYEKFNSKIFQGRRWRGVDDVKEAQAAALRVANKISSYTRENADIGNDFEEIALEQAEDKMILEAFGINPLTTAETPVQAPEDDEEDEVENEPSAAEKKPKKSKALARK